MDERDRMETQNEIKPLILYYMNRLHDYGQKSYNTINGSQKQLTFDSLRIDHLIRQKSYTIINGSQTQLTFDSH